ncbi:ribosomal maturation YjgA family protein [Streptomyces ziwulingensis]
MTSTPGTRPDADADGAAIRVRGAAAVAALVIVGAGLGLRAVATGEVAKYGGDALYTLLVFALVVLAAPGTSPLKAGGVALAVSWCVEFLQLSDLPAELSRQSTAARLVLGSTFNAPDLFWYAVGAATGWLAARLLRRGAGGHGPG